jgi:DNA-binding MltR family transcriptional regulator
VAAAFLDEALEALLLSYMSSEEAANKSIGELFRPRGALGTFAAKIDLYRAFGWIAQDDYEDLTKIRRLRNDFAHSHGPVDFPDTAASDRVRTLPICQSLSGSR